jgi:hypothetical protein
MEVVMVRRSSRFSALALLAAALAGAGCAGGDESAPPTTVAGAESDVATAGSVAPAPEADDDVPDTSAMIDLDLDTLPPSFRRVVELAGQDRQEANCIAEGVAAGVGSDPGDEDGGDLDEQADVQATIAGSAVVGCLPPAKLASALTERLRSPVLGLGLDDDQVNCARAVLVADAGAPAHAELVGGLALEDGVVVRRGAAGLDASCGTDLALPISS